MIPIIASLQLSRKIISRSSSMTYVIETLAFVLRNPESESM